MQPSIISLLGMRFFEVKVWPQEDENFDQPNYEDFDFDGVEIEEASHIFPINEEEKEPTLFSVILKILIQNNNGKPAPYNIEIGAIGNFKINKTVPNNQRKDIVYVNGCSMLYGAIREQVMNITARSVHGMLVLPTANFQDKIQNKDEEPEQEKDQGPEQAEPKPKKRKRVTKPKES